MKFCNYGRRRLLPYLMCFNFLVCLCYLIPLRLEVIPSSLDISGEDLATDAIQRAMGPKGSNASHLVLPHKKTAIFQPKPEHCQREGQDTYVLFVVISSPGNWLAREAIRANLKTAVNAFNKNQWHGHPTRNNSLLFFAGVSKNANTQRKLEEEAEVHGDLVIDNLLDSYLNMTVKVLRMFKWIQTNCSHLKFLVKVDDDVHLNLLKLFEYLNSLSAANAEADLLVAGHHYTGKKPVRTVFPPYGKWFVPIEVWPKEIYPDFIGGPAYVLGTKALQKIYSRSLDTPLFHLEDVFVTGLVGNAALGLKLSGIERALVDWPKRGNLVHSSCFIQNQFLVHSLTPEDIKCWRRFNSKDFVCSTWPLAISTMFC